MTDLEVFNRYHRQAAALATEKVQVNYSKKLIGYADNTLQVISN